MGPRGAPRYLGSIWSDMNTFSIHWPRSENRSGGGLDSEGSDSSLLAGSTARDEARAAEWVRVAVERRVPQTPQSLGELHARSCVGHAEAAVDSPRSSI